MKNTIMIAATLATMGASVELTEWIDWFEEWKKAEEDCLTKSYDVQAACIERDGCHEPPYLRQCVEDCRAEGDASIDPCMNLFFDSLPDYLK